MSDERSRAPQAGELSRISGQYLGHGLTVALGTLLFSVIGWWGDSKWGTTPVLTILGAFVGAGSGFYRLYHHVVIEPSLKSKDAEDEQ